MNGALLLVTGVVALNLYALALVLLRAPLFGVRIYQPMLVNMALSVAPALVVALALLILTATAIPGALSVWVTLTVGGLAWLLLLPNSTYLITELNFSHRREGESVPLWFDIVATLSLALSGVMNALVNVLVCQVIFVVVSDPEGRHAFEKPGSWIAAGIILFLSTVGIYVGRYLRLNTWDVLRPARLLRKIGSHFAEPGRVGEAIGFCALHTLLLVILYAIVIAPMVFLL